MALPGRRCQAKNRNVAKEDSKVRHLTESEGALLGFLRGFLRLTGSDLLR